jgi:hypothetical protein
MTPTLVPRRIKVAVDLLAALNVQLGAQQKTECCRAKRLTRARGASLRGMQTRTCFIPSRSARSLFSGADFWREEKVEIIVIPAGYITSFASVVTPRSG